MDKILFINGCIRSESRTLILAKHLLSKLEGEIEEVNLEREGIPALTGDILILRGDLLAREQFEHPMLRYARQFKEADIIVIAAPYYDLSFSSNLKNYLEAVACVGLTFYYDENEVAQPHTKARKLYYVSTGGGVLKKQYGFEYVKALVGEFYHIFDVQGFFAEKLDLLDSDPEAIMQEALENIDAAFEGQAYNKLVRDKIPEIIRANGLTPVVRTLNDVEYYESLRRKLNEEVAEFHADQNSEELTDIMEVLFALAETMNLSREELVALCNKKRAERGGFGKRQFLISKK